jgi:hypothetical protein
MAQSKELTAFYRWWLEESQKDDPIESVKRYGLCSNIYLYCGNYNLNGYCLFCEMTNQFNKEGPCGLFPFNSDGSYAAEVFSDSCHLNPKRVQWVKDHL